MSFQSKFHQLVLPKNEQYSVYFKKYVLWLMNLHTVAGIKYCFRNKIFTRYYKKCICKECKECNVRLYIFTTKNKLYLTFIVLTHFSNWSGLCSWLFFLMQTCFHSKYLNRPEQVAIILKNIWKSCLNTKKLLKLLSKAFVKVGCLKIPKVFWLFVHSFIVCKTNLRNISPSMLKKIKAHVGLLVRI
jgi:hypothetical protein